MPYTQSSCRYSFIIYSIKCNLLRWRFNTRNAFRAQVFDHAYIMYLISFRANESRSSKDRRSFRVYAAIRLMKNRNRSTSVPRKSLQRRYIARIHIHSNTQPRVRMATASVIIIIVMIYIGTSTIRRRVYSRLPPPLQVRPRGICSASRARNPPPSTVETEVAATYATHNSYLAIVIIVIVCYINGILL